MRGRSSSALSFAAISLGIYLVSALLAFLTYELHLPGPSLLLAAGLSLPGVLFSLFATSDFDLTMAAMARVVLESALFWLIVGALIGAITTDKRRSIAVCAAIASASALIALCGFGWVVANLFD